MKIRQSLLFIAIIIYSCASGTVFSQETTPLSLDKGTIENRFNYVLKNASDYEDSKVLKSWWLRRLKTYVQDSLVSLKDSIGDAYRIISIKDMQIDSLVVDLQTVNQKLTETVDEKNSLSFLGIIMPKAAYNAILWGIIILLVIFLFLFFILYKRSNKVTTETKGNFTELKEEFETFRKRALEREQQIAREMYDEIIKYKRKLGEL